MRRTAAPKDDLHYGVREEGSGLLKVAHYREELSLDATCQQFALYVSLPAIFV